LGGGAIGGMPAHDTGVAVAGSSALKISCATTGSNASATWSSRSSGQTFWSTMSVAGGGSSPLVYGTTSSSWSVMIVVYWIPGTSGPPSAFSSLTMLEPAMNSVHEPQPSSIML